MDPLAEKKVGQTWQTQMYCEGSRSLGTLKVDSSITQAEVTEVVRNCKLLCGKVPGVDEICPESTSSLWMLWGCLGSHASAAHCMEVGDSTSGVANCRVVVPLFKKGDRRVCSNYSYRGITLLSLPGKVTARVLERRIRPIVEPQDSGGTMRFLSRLWNTGPALYPPQGA
ncbi:hypothetical protein L3Q82_014355 [Scortum barcoo]|uniref:Uncharacterized protein n=1 Tax=Scortum barcoo TaxID=214431 RepID=A0ACB8VWD7_9TELE|nr:hypothetical protein L3Q82_014355 [Scortum barcoo]